MHFSDKLMDHKRKYTHNIRVSECYEYKEKDTHNIRVSECYVYTCGLGGEADKYTIPNRSSARAGPTHGFLPNPYHCMAQEPQGGSFRPFGP